MTNLIVLVDKVEDWKPFFPSDQIVKASDYLFKKDYQILQNVRVLNLCHNISYLSMGYYCSLVAESRKHKVTPTVKTINDLSKKKFYLFDLEELEESVEKVATQLTKNNKLVKSLEFKIFFGETNVPELKKIARQIFEQYPCPILEVTISHKDIWKIDSIYPLGLRDLNDEDETFFANALDRYSTKIWRNPKSSKIYKYDLAILWDEKEELKPSDEKAIKMFEQACKAKSVYCEIISKKDIARLSEFDGLFIRQTTSITNFTYHFAKKATSEGLVVIDDPDSILKCTNKIFLANLFLRNGVPIIPGRFVSEAKKATLDELEAEFGYPMVLKIPDGSFSLGVKKAKDRNELEELLKSFLKKTALVLIQKFFYTDFDWRVGIIGGKPLYVCKYYMSKGHWQIYNHGTKKTDDDFTGNFETMKIEDAPKHVIKSAVKAAQLIGNSLYGVDLKDDGTTAYVVEVNDNPNIDFGVEDQVLKRELYEIIIDEFVNRIDKLKHKDHGTK